MFQCVVIHADCVFTQYHLKMYMLSWKEKTSFVLFSGLDLAQQDTDTSSDLMLAQMLQMEFDKEFDTQLRREEKKFNGESKGKSFSNLYMDQC